MIHTREVDGEIISDHKVSFIREIKKKCPICPNGEMISTGEIIVNSTGENYIHRCKNCINSETYHTPYPKIQIITNTDQAFELFQTKKVD